MKVQQKSRVAILVPGIFDRGKSMHRIKDNLEKAGFRAHYINLKPNSGWHGLEPLAQQVHDLVETVTEHGETCAVVGFSMGGIVARYYLQRLGGTARVHKLVTISSPHFGSFWARFLPYRGGRQLCIGSDFLNDLNREIALLEPTAPVSIWTPYDITVVPHSSSCLPLGRSFCIPVSLHRWVPLNRKVIELVTTELKTAL
ncbi:esterase/lipase family protein [Microbulbifer celer]|uniref:Esterase/lipase family protein n=1 Tax=Microbulbifer celer TaxID=435905 RepID=A0ABW3UEQ3_9GAMM|nr:alpha/beta fold hydrolase [Microbulbifer celer]UFN56005.1 lipase [Microbulbifer celer]